MGEIIEVLAWIFGGIFWLLMTAYEKGTGRTLSLLDTLFLLLLSAILCSGTVCVLCRLLFPA